MEKKPTLPLLVELYKVKCYQMYQLIKDICGEAGTTVIIVYQNMHTISSFITQCQHAQTLGGQVPMLMPTLCQQISQSLS